MSHGHDDHHDHGHEEGHSEYEGHEEGHGGHGHEEDAHAGHGGRGSGHGHGDGRHADSDHGHGDFEEEEPMFEPAGIMNDLWMGDGSDSVVDLAEFFPVSKVTAVRHNDGRPFNDVRKGPAAPIDFSKKRTLRISKYRTKKTSDILKRSECAPSLVSYVDKTRPVRPEPVNVLPELPIPDSAVDVRNLEPLPPLRLHADLFEPKRPVPERIWRYAKKRRRKILRIGASGIVVGTVFVGGTVAAISYAQTGVEKAYGSLFELKSEAKNGSDAFLSAASDAENRFTKLRFFLFPIETAFDSSVVSIPAVRTATSVVRGGSHVAAAARIVGTVWKDFSNALPAGTDPLSAFGSGSSFKATDFLEGHLEDFRLVDEELSKALAEYARVETLGNPELDARFQSAVTLLISAQSQLRFFLSHENALLAAAGHRSPQRYLILNQNRDELRATGGFPGSAVFVELYKGRLSKYEKKDIYYYDWHLFPYAEKAPPGLDQITEKWGLRDANYYPEMSRNFETIDAFYQKSGGASLNGIVAMNQGIAIDFLQKYGPVRLEKIGKTVDASNFSTLMSVLVENGVNKETNPKDVLFDFVEALEKSLLEKKDFAGYFEILDQNAKTGEILAYSNDSEVNAFFSEIFPGERSKSFSGNFVYPVFTSLSGNKSDRYVFRTFDLKSEPMDGCRVLNGFRMESDHRMTFDDKEKVRKLLYDFGVPPEAHEKQIFIQGNGENKQYVRVLAPKGSKLSGRPPIQIEVDDSMPDYTVFAFTLTTPVGQKAAAFFDYESSPKDCSKKLEFFRQSGLQNYLVRNE